MKQSLISRLAGILAGPRLHVVESLTGSPSSSPSTVSPVIPFPPTVSNAPAVTPEVANLIADLSKVPGIGQEIYSAYKTKGAPGALQAALSHVSDVTKTFGDVQAALPSVKSGYKTSEFWLTIGYAVGAQVITMLNPHLSPSVVNILEISSAVLPVVYTLSRALVKINAPAPSQSSAVVKP